MDSETFRPAAIARVIADEPDNDPAVLRKLARGIFDIPRMIENAHRAVDEFAAKSGLVEVVVFEGDEPEEGAEVALAAEDEQVHELVGPVDCVDGVVRGLCWRCEKRDVAADRPCPRWRS